MRQALIIIKDYLAANLEHTILEVEAEQSIQIQRWKFMEIYENYSNQYPSFEIIPSETRIDYGSPDKPIIEGLTRFDVDIDISVAGHDPKTINNTILGYEAALRKLLACDETFGGAFVWVLIRGIPFSPLIKESKLGAVLKILTIGITVKSRD